jgi:hypothetical protein
VTYQGLMNLKSNSVALGSGIVAEAERSVLYEAS